VAEQHERRPVARLAERRDQIRPVVRGTEDLGREARVVRQAREVLDRRAFVAGWIDGVEADELGEQVGRVALERVVGDGDGMSLPAPRTIVARNG
jgi:hypothetical protein